MSADSKPSPFVVRVNGRPVDFTGFPVGGAGDDGPLGGLRLAHVGALEALRGVEARRVALEADEKLSPVGRKEALKAHVRSETLPALARFRAKVLEPQAEALRKRLAELTPAEAVVPGDVVAEMRLAEIRGVLRALPPKERTDALYAGSPEVRRAVLLADPIASGVAPPIFDAIRRRAIEERHGAEKLEELTELASAADAVEAALTKARKAAVEVAGILGSEAANVEEGA